MTKLLLPLWLALIGADRIDFFAGSGPVLLTPFLILTVLIVGLEVLRLLGEGGRFRVPPNAATYALIAGAFLAVVLVSVFYSYDMEVSARRYALLAFQVYGALLVAMVLVQRPDPRSILVRGAYLGLAIGTVFNAFQVASFFERGAGEYLLFGGLVDMTANVYGTWVPRLAGQAFDMNRGGILFMVYVFLLLRLARPSRLRTLAVTVGVAAIVMSLSRSVLLAVMGTGLAILLLEKRFVVSRGGVVKAAVAASVLAGILLVSPRGAEVLGAALDPIASRFDVSEGSANVHLELIARGFEIAAESPKNALVGIGYGNSYAYVDDVFPDDKYGNLHSLYLSLLVESGGLALILAMVLLGYPALKGGRYRPLIVGLAFFNIFYQLSAEAIFWFVLVLGWTGVGDPSRGAQPVPPPPSAEPRPDTLAAARRPAVAAPFHPR